MDALAWQMIALEGGIVLTLMLMTHALASRHSLAPFFAVMGAFTLLSWWSGLLQASAPGAFDTQLTLAALIPALLAGLLMVYVLDGPKAGRVLLFSVALLSLVSPTFGFLFLQDSGLMDANANWTNTVSGTVTLVADFLVMGAGWEWLRRRLPAALIFVPLLVTVGLLDLLLYHTLLQLLQGQWPSLAAGPGWMLRAQVSLAYGLVLLPYVLLRWRHQPREDQQRPLLAALKHESLLQEEITHIRQEMERKNQLEQSLLDRSTLFHSLFEMSPAAILLCDLDGCIVEANPAARSLIQELGTDEPIERIQQLMGADILRHLQHGLNRSQTPQPVLEIIGGQEYAITAMPVNLTRDSHGMALLLQNLSEREQTEDELIRHDRLESLSVLAGGIAHDFNNLLTGILAGLSLARMQLAEAEPIESMQTLDEVEEQAKMASRLTHQLLTFSKGGEPALKTLPVEDFLEESVRFALRGSAITAGYELAADLWPVRADQGQLQQVINNLVINAVQAMDGKGSLIVSADNVSLRKPYKTLPAGEYVRIRFCDQGPGIPEALVERIFDPFFTTKKQGHGLGLASAFSILKRHGGLLECHNRQQGGACFALYLPRGESSDVSGLRTITLARYRARVLVMDDQETIRKLLSRMLGKIGLEVTTARNGEEAVILYQQAMASGHKYDLVILDLTVPDGMGGEECMRNLQDIDPEVKAVVSSGYAESPVMARATEYGFIDRLCKPYTIGDAWALITRVLPEHARSEASS